MQEKHTNTISTHKRGAALPRPASKARISPALRKAIKLRVEEGMTITEVCLRAGISEAGWYKAMLRPAVQRHLESVQAQFVREIDRRRATYKAQAVEVAHHLMHKATSEQVRMRAVEFFSGEGRGPAVAVQVNMPVAQGYSYTRPDGASSAGSSQVIDVKANSDDV